MDGDIDVAIIALDQRVVVATVFLGSPTDKPVRVNQLGIDLYVSWFCGMELGIERWWCWTDWASAVVASIHHLGI